MKRLIALLAALVLASSTLVFAQAPAQTDIPKAEKSAKDKKGHKGGKQEEEKTARGMNKTDKGADTDKDKGKGKGKAKGGGNEKDKNQEKPKKTA